MKKPLGKYQREVAYAGLGAGAAFILFLLSLVVLFFFIFPLWWLAFRNYDHDNTLTNINTVNVNCSTVIGEFFLNYTLIMDPREFSLDDEKSPIAKSSPNNVERSRRQLSKFYEQQQQQLQLGLGSDNFPGPLKVTYQLQNKIVTFTVHTFDLKNPCNGWFVSDDLPATLRPILSEYDDQTYRAEGRMFNYYSQFELETELFIERIYTSLYLVRIVWDTSGCVYDAKAKAKLVGNTNGFNYTATSLSLTYLIPL